MCIYTYIYIYIYICVCVCVCVCVCALVCLFPFVNIDYLRFHCLVVHAILLGRSIVCTLIGTTDNSAFWCTSVETLRWTAGHAITMRWPGHGCEDWRSMSTSVTVLLGSVLRVRYFSEHSDILSILRYKLQVWQLQAFVKCPLKNLRVGSPCPFDIVLIYSTTAAM